MPPESWSTESRRRSVEARELQAAVHGRAHVLDPVEPREHGQVVLHRHVHVEVVELRHHAHLGARLLGLGRQLVAEHAQIEPSSAIAWPVSMRIVVDLPAPFGPSRPRQMPCGTSRSRPSTAVIGPKRLTTPLQLDRGHRPPQTTYSTTGERTLRIFSHAYKEKLIARD